MSRALSIMLLTSFALLASCGDDTDGSSTEPAAATVPSSSPASDAEAAFPVTIEHRYGTTVIPDEPERVVAAGFNDADYALAFGVTPVAVRDFIGPFLEESRPWTQDALAGAEPEKISNNDGTLNFEAIAVADPDLILAYSYLEENEYERLAQIAPTVVEPEEGSRWPDHTRDVGRALGQAERAEELVDEVEVAFARTTDEHPDFEGTTIAIQFGVGGESTY